MARKAHTVVASAVVITAFFAWAGLLGLGRLTNSGFLPDDAPLTADNARLSAHYGAGSPDLVLLARADQGADSAPAVREGQALQERVSRARGVVSATSYWSSGDPALRSRDGRTALITVDLVENEGAATQAARDLVPTLTGRHGPLQVSATGPAWMSEQGMRQSRRDLLVGELIAVPLSAVVLLFVFRSLVAALIPLLTGAVAVTGTLACLAALTYVTELSVYAANITCALGFGLAVDYGLFVVTRYREEKAAGAGSRQAVLRSRRTAGRTVVVSAGVVALSLCALFVFPFGFIRSVATAGILVALWSAAAALWLVPALLSVCGPYLGRWDVFARLRRRDPLTPAAQESMAWRRIGLAVCRHPLSFAGAAVVLLAVMALPFTHAAFAPSDARVLPAGNEAHRAQLLLESAFPHAPARVVTIGLPPGTGPAALEVYARKASALPGAAEVRTKDGLYRAGRHQPAHPAAPGPAAAAPATAGPLLTVITGSDRTTRQSGQLVRALRELPAPGGKSLLTGEAVRVVDTADTLSGALPLAGALAAAVTMLALAWFTRSVLIPLKAVAVAALSLSACVGCIVFVFQDGHFRTLLGGFTASGTVDGSVVLFVLIVAYALSVDYEVFLLSRVREEYLAAGDNTTAVVHGLQRTGRLITAASLIVMSAMAALASSGVTLLKVVGVGLAVGILVDATLVRGVLVPALMTLAGRWNWWFPARRRARPADDRRSTAAEPEGADHAR
ncbi:MMPL family transporter [Streptomyces syringium]|uniref:MMPL family transporter n=1 Tax=Streptomyces syringium TaxID=76729 RepID=UPI0036EBF675